ncbi:TRAP transporter small permease subunit [Candidatus Litorirhabdus singularis]|nr:TRAP transporter small permease subunit [Candidatus Litorirhabdus singularis]
MISTVKILIRIIDNVTDRFGALLAWLCLAMALATGIVVILRYGFGIGSIALQESVTYMHATLFMLGAAYTLRSGGHVRVDIFYRSFSDRSRAWVNSFGAIVFLMPLCLIILGISWRFVTESWAVRESSVDPGGIPAVFLLKSIIPLMAINLLFQGFAELLRNALTLLVDEDSA